MKISAGAFETSWHIEKINGEVWQYVKEKWLEVKELILENEELVEKILTEEIFTRFEVPREILTNKGAQFTLNLI